MWLLGTFVGLTAFGGWVARSVILLHERTVSVWYVSAPIASALITTVAVVVLVVAQPLI